MPEIKGTTWDFGGNQLDIKNALALVRAKGFSGREEVITAVCVMTAESQRYARAWHHNHEHEPDRPDVHVISNETGQPVILSTDRGIFQINDKAHPDLDPEVMFNPRRNAEMAREVWRNRGRSFEAWAAFNSGAYLRFWDEVAQAYFRGVWRERVEKWAMG